MCFQSGENFMVSVTNKANYILYNLRLNRLEKFWNFKHGEKSMSNLEKVKKTNSMII